MGEKKRGRPVTNNDPKSVAWRQYMSLHRLEKKKDPEWVKKNRENQKRLERKYRRNKRLRLHLLELETLLKDVKIRDPLVYSNPTDLAHIILGVFCIRKAKPDGETEFTGEK